MTMRQAAHARQVVERFKAFLSEDEQAQLGEEHFDELSLLIESAIDASVLDAMERAADELDALARKMRDQAERFDDETSTA